MIGDRHRRTRRLATDYIPLEAEESDPILHVKESTPPSTAKRTVWSVAIYIGLGSCAVMTLLNAYFVHTILRASEPPAGVNPYTNHPLSSPLPRPNQFIGLENVNRSYPGFVKPGPIVTLPHVLTQVDRMRAKYVYPDDTRRWYSWAGTVSPDDKQFFINETTSTITQFRTLDFGMELCNVVFNISSPETLSKEADPLYPFDRSFYSSAEAGSAVPIAIYRLSSEQVLDVRSLSWSSKPARSELIGVYHLGEGTTIQTPLFNCPSDSLQTFEFSCAPASATCTINWWQNARTSLGLFVMQHSSL